MKNNCVSSFPDRVKKHGIILLVNILPMMYAITCIIPIIWIFLSSMKTMSEFSANPISLPECFTLDAYKTIFTKSDLWINILNSAWNTIVSVVFVVIFGFINGYFLARFKFRGRNFLYGYYLCELLIPVHALLLPLYVMFNNFGFTNNRFTLLPIYIGAGLATTTFLMQGYVQSIPRSLEEAAAIDGSSFHHTLIHIILPLTKPVLATVSIIHMFYCWNEFSFALILLSKKQYFTVSLALMAFKSRNRVDYPSMMAVMFVAMIPALLAYTFFSKHIIQGMVAGAVKG